MDFKAVRILSLIITALLTFLIGTLWAANVRIEIDPTTGRPQVISEVPIVTTTTTPTGWTVITLSTGERFSYFIDPAGNVFIQVFSGEINITAQNTTIRVEANEAAIMNINKETGAVQVIATTGSIDVTAQGQSVSVNEGQQTTVTAGMAPSTPTSAPSVPSAPPPAPPAPPPPPPPPPVPPASPAE